MTRRGNLLIAGLGAVLLLGAAGWGLSRWLPRPQRSAPGAFQKRAERRAYDGAPPVIPHPPLGGSCTTCHAAQAREVPGVGVAPPNPHRKTLGLSNQSRCQQCHVFQTTETDFAGSTFRGLPQTPRRGDRLYATAPPTLPHPVFMREDCRACHAGDSARTEIRYTHPERANCLQCHARTLSPAREREPGVTAK
jgi:cytochrome c-type protein NapB